MNNWAILQALIFEPRRAVEAIAERPKFLFPLLLTWVAATGLVFWYYHVVDLAWLTDRSIRSSAFASRMTEAQIEAQVAAAGGNPTRAAVIAVIAASVGIVIIRLLEALYFVLAGKVTNVQRSFGQWFSLACWTSLVSTVLAVIPSAIVLLMATTAQVDQGDLQPLSLNSLLFHRTFDQPGFSLLTSIHVLHFFALYLAALGVRIWSGRSWTFSAVFASLPWVLICSVWAYLSMGRA
jgi:Yip1 domain